MLDGQRRTENLRRSGAGRPLDLHRRLRGVLRVAPSGDAYVLKVRAIR